MYNSSQARTTYVLNQLSLQLFSLLLSAIVCAFQLSLDVLLNDTQLLLLVLLGHPDLNAHCSLATRAHKQIQKQTHMHQEKSENLQLKKTAIKKNCNSETTKLYKTKCDTGYEKTPRCKITRLDCETRTTHNSIQIYYKTKLTCSFSLSSCFLRCSSRCSEAMRRRSSRELRTSSVCFSFDCLSLSTISN